MSIGKKLKAEFPFFKYNPEHIYFDTAATSLKPQCVIDAISDYYSKFGTNPHNMDSDLSYLTGVQHHYIREKICKFINAMDSSEVVFTPGTTYSLNQIAYGISEQIEPGDEICITNQEHGANILPWYRLAKEKKAIIKFLPETHYKIDLLQLEKVINPKTKIVSFANISNILGYQNDTALITKKIKDINPSALVVIDCAQGVSHIKTDVKLWNADFIAFSAHKIFGPTGIGILWGKKKVLKQLRPLILGGGMNTRIDPNGLDYTLRTLPEALEGGSPNIANIFGFGAAIDFINQIGQLEIFNYTQSLKEYAVLQFATKLKDKVVLYNSDNLTPTLVFNVKNFFAQDVATHLGAVANMTVRSGDHCARLIGKVIPDVNTVRISFSIYNCKEDIDQLVAILLAENYFLGRLI